MQPKPVFASLVMAVLIIGGGCATERTVRYHEPALRMENSGLCTLGGTSKERLLTKFGQPDDVTRGQGGRETLHYQLAGTLTTETAYPLVGTRVITKDVTEDLYVDIEGGIVTSGRWKHYDGVSRW